MSKYPIFLELSGRTVVVVGAGSVAVEKVKKLLSAGAKITIIAQEITKPLAELCQNTNITLVKTKYSKTYLAGAALVIAATDDQPLNEQIYNDCQALKIFCNVVDNPSLCDFFVPAIAEQGHIQIAISTDGKCPAYAAEIRKKLEQLFTEDNARFLDELETIRQRLIEQFSELADRKKLLQQLVGDESFEFFKQNGPAAWHNRAENIIKKHKDK